MFIPLEVGPGGKKLTTGKEETPEGEFFGYYEGAKEFLGTISTFVSWTEKTTFIKCDVAGKGVPASPHHGAGCNGIYHLFPAVERFERIKYGPPSVSNQ